VISVHGVVFAHYSVEDRAAEAYAMITLWESEYATQTQIARAFGYSARSLRRYQERFGAEGIQALVRKPGRPAGRRSGGAKERGRDQTILHLKTKGASNRAIAGKLGLSEKAIRKRAPPAGMAAPGGARGIRSAVRAGHSRRCISYSRSFRDHDRHS